MKKFVILNAYGQKNIGDEAIQYSAFSILDSVVKSLKVPAVVTVLCEDPQTFPRYSFSSLKIHPILMPYGYSLRYITELFKPLQKVIVAIKILLFSGYYVFLSLFSSSLLPLSGPYSYIKKILEADKIIGIGGGYLISKETIKDLYGISLTVLPILIAKLYKKDILHLPISVGPFASDFHEKIIYFSLKNTIVYLRENISYNLLKKYDINNKTQLHVLPDLALFLRNPNKVIRKNSYWVMTAREWLPKAEQNKYERALAYLIDDIWEKNKITCVFIIMVKNVDEDNDENVYNRINNYIKNKHALIKYVPKSHHSVQLALSNAIFSVCTRMHSAILSLTVNCPFLTIGYGHKGKGFMESIGLSRWYLDISSVNESTLFKKFNSFFNQQNIVNLKKQLQLIKADLDKQQQTLVRDLMLFLET